MYGRAITLGIFQTDTLDDMLGTAINVHAIAAELDVVFPPNHHFCHPLHC